MKSASRKRAYSLGLDAEFWAEILLRLKGYSIRERRYLAHGGEVDLIAMRGKTLVFVEVKARRSLDEAQATITSQKLERIARAARTYLSRQSRQPATIRCDAILIAPNRFPRHIQAIGELPGF